LKIRLEGGGLLEQGGRFGETPLPLSDLLHDEIPSGVGMGGNPVENLLSFFHAVVQELPSALADFIGSAISAGIPGEVGVGLGQRDAGGIGIGILLAPAFDQFEMPLQSSAVGWPGRGVPRPL